MSNNNNNFMNWLKKRAKGTGVPLTFVRNGKRVAKTQERLAKDVRNRDRRDEHRIANRVRKLEAKIISSPYHRAVAGNIFMHWNNDISLKPKLITEGIKLWNDIKKFYKKRGIRNNGYAGNYVNQLYETFNVANMNSGMWLFFGELNARGANRFRSYHEER